VPGGSPAPAPAGANAPIILGSIGSDSGVLGQILAPVLMGGGENLFAGLDLVALGYQSTEHVAGPGVTHVTVKRKSP